MVIKDLCFEILQKCTNNCLFCSSESCLHSTDFIDFKTFKNTIEYLLKQGTIEEISLSGGEPMLHPDIFGMVAFCHEKGMKTTLYTSGIVVNNQKLTSENEHINKILKQQNGFRDISVQEFNKLEQVGLDKVVFDVQAGEVDEYNDLMGTKNNMSHLLKSLLHSSYFKFEKSVHFIPNKKNIKQFKDVLELAELAGIEELRVLKFVPQGRGRQNKEELQLSNEELKTFVEKARNIKSKITNIKIGIPLMSENQHICTAGFDKLVIRYDGQVLPCPAFKDMDLKLLENKGFKNINIFKNLEDYQMQESNHNKPLCEQFGRHNNEI